MLLDGRTQETPQRRRKWLEDADDGALVLALRNAWRRMQPPQQFCPIPIDRVACVCEFYDWGGFMDFSYQGPNTALPRKLASCRTALMVSCAVLASVIPAQAWAQNAQAQDAQVPQTTASLAPAGTATTPATPPPASSTAPAGDNATTGLQEIVVTAQKRAQNVQDTPLSVTAVSGANLAI